MFYANKSSTQLVKDMMLESGDMYISKILWEGTGVLAIGVGATDTLTPATSPEWTINEFASTVGINLEIIDDNDIVTYGKVISNTATAITFDDETLILDSTGAIGGALTTAGTYTFRLLSPSADYEYGDFFGYVDDVSVSTEQETVEYKRGIPRELIVEDLLENINEITGSIKTWLNKDVLMAVMGFKAYGLQTGQFELGSGTKSFTSSFYRLALKGDSRIGKTVTFLFHRVKFSATGEVSFEEEDYKMLPFSGTVFSDQYRDDEANRIRIIKEE